MYIRRQGFALKYGPDQVTISINCGTMSMQRWLSDDSFNLDILLVNVIKYIIESRLNEHLITLFNLIKQPSTTTKVSISLMSNSFRNTREYKQECVAFGPGDWYAGCLLLRGCQSTRFLVLSCCLPPQNER